jgi:transglutaminase-like putative cysteine protease
MFLIKVSDKEKEIFTPLIKQILKEDKSNNLDYIKIGNWIKKNISYDKHIPIIKKNPIDTFKSKKGTCNDLTNLYNCLLKIIGIKTIFVSGYVIEENKYDNNGGNDFDYHCWSVAEINNKFIPLDVNFQYYNGKIPNTHLFGCFGNSNIDIKCTEKIILEKIEEKIIKY